MKDDETVKEPKVVKEEETLIEAKVGQVLEAVNKKSGKTKRPVSGADHSPPREPSSPGPLVHR